MLSTAYAAGAAHAQSGAMVMAGETEG